jgi:hypothetical protein
MNSDSQSLCSLFTESSRHFVGGSRFLKGTAVASHGKGFPVWGACLKFFFAVYYRQGMRAGGGRTGDFMSGVRYSLREGLYYVGAGGFLSFQSLSQPLVTGLSSREGLQRKARRERSD